jgi:S1-C subfamily serine protease
MNISELSSGFADLVANAQKSLVFVRGGRCEAASGVAWSRDLVVTAANAFERERGLTATFSDGQKEAILLGADAASNLAVLRVEAELSPLAHADSSALRPGELALALSRGARGTRARLGMIARVGGEWRLAGGLRVERYVESDIPPAPGLSGSVLVGAQGALIGINLAGIVRGSLVTLPASSAKAIVDSIVAHGRVRRARLGVALERVELPRALAERLGRRYGLVVLSVLEGGPAERAGVLLGDVVLAVAGTAVESVDALQGVLGEQSIGQELSVDLLRAATQQTLGVTPEAR